MPRDLNARAVPRKIGVAIFIWPLVPLGFGAYRLYHDPRSSVSLIWNIFLVLFGLFGLALAAFVRGAGRLVTPTGAGEQISAMQRQLFGGLHTYRDASENDLRRLDRTFYESVTRDLLACGFREVRDIVDVTASNTWPRNHAVLRCFLGDEGAAMASAFHLKLYGFVGMLQLIGVIPRKLQAIECETELSDGTYVTTNNAAESNRTLGYPFMDRLQFPKKTPASQIAREHRDHLISVLSSKPGVTPIRCVNYEDLRAVQNRLQLLKSAHRTSPKFDHYAEWQKIVGRPLREAESEAFDQFGTDMADPSLENTSGPSETPAKTSGE